MSEGLQRVRREGDDRINARGEGEKRGIQVQKKKKRVGWLGRP